MGEQRQALLLHLQQTPAQGFRPSPRLLGQHLLDAAANELGTLVFAHGEQTRLCAERLPDELQQAMHEVAAHARIQTAVRRDHVGSAEAVDGKGAKRTCRLILEHRHAAPHRPIGVDRRRALVIEPLERRRRRVHPRRIRRHAAHGKRIGLARGQMRDQRARAQRLVAATTGVAHHHLLGARQHAPGPLARPGELLLAAGARHAALALKCERQEWIRARRLRPRLVVQPREPQVRVVESDGLQHAENLHRRGARARLKHLSRRQPLELRQRLGEIDPRHHRRERSQCAEQLPPCLHRLILVARERAIARPARAREPRRELRGPDCQISTPRAARAVAAQRVEHAHESGAGAAGGFVEASRQLAQAHERVMRLTDAAQLRIETRAPAETTTAQIGRYQPAPRILQRQPAAHGTQARERVRHHGHLGERLAERDIERTRRRLGARARGARREHVLEDRRNPVTDRREPRDDDTDGAAGTVLEARARPAGRRLELVVLAGKAHPRDLCRTPRRLPVRDLQPEPRERLEHRLLLRRRPIESGQQHPARAGRGDRFEPLAGQPPGEARRVQPVAATAVARVSARPGAKGPHLLARVADIVLRIDLPVTQKRPCGTGIARRVGGVQQRRLAVSQRVLGDHLLPQTRILIGGEQRRHGLFGACDEIVPAALKPGRIGNDVRALPDDLAGRQAGAVELRAQHPRQAPVDGEERRVSVKGIQRHRPSLFSADNSATGGSTRRR